MFIFPFWLFHIQPLSEMMSFFERQLSWPVFVTHKVTLKKEHPICKWLSSWFSEREQANWFYFKSMGTMYYGVYQSVRTGSKTVDVLATIHDVETAKICSDEWEASDEQNCTQFRSGWISSTESRSSGSANEFDSVMGTRRWGPSMLKVVRSRWWTNGKQFSIQSILKVKYFTPGTFKIDSFFAISLRDLSRS